MFVIIAEIILKESLKKIQLTKTKSYLNWDKIDKIALIVNNQDLSDKTAFDKYINNMGKKIEVFYIELISQEITSSEWQCLSKRDVNFLGLLKKNKRELFDSKKYDVIINTSDDNILFSNSLASALKSTMSVSVSNRYNNFDLVIKKQKPFNLINYIEDVIRYLKMINV